MYLVLGHTDEHSAPMNNTVLQVCSPFEVLIPKPYRQIRKTTTSYWDFRNPQPSGPDLQPFEPIIISIQALVNLFANTKRAKKGISDYSKLG